MGSPCFKKTAGCIGRDPAAHLHSAGESRQRRKGLFKIFLVRILFPDGVEENDVASAKTHFPVQFRVIAGSEVRREVLAGSALFSLPAVTERAPDDLFDFAIMYINAWSDPHKLSPYIRNCGEMADPFRRSAYSDIYRSCCLI